MLFLQKIDIKMKSNNFCRDASQYIYSLSASVIIPLFLLAACQPATVQSEDTAGLARSHKHTFQINMGQNNKNTGQSKTIGENTKPIKFSPPRSIIVIEEINETKNQEQNQAVQIIDEARPTDQKMEEQKTAAEIAAATPHPINTSVLIFPLVNVLT